MLLASPYRMAWSNVFSFVNPCQNSEDSILDKFGNLRLMKPGVICSDGNNNLLYLRLLFASSFKFASMSSPSGSRNVPNYGLVLVSRSAKQRCQLPESTKTISHERHLVWATFRLWTASCTYSKLLHSVYLVLAN